MGLDHLTNKSGEIAYDHYYKNHITALHVDVTFNEFSLNIYAW